jgi:hypothetical protein
MSGNQIHFTYALWNSPVEQAMLCQGETIYTVTYHSDEHCTLTMQQGQAPASRQVLSLAACEDYLGERGLLRAHGWQSVYPESWLAGELESQKAGRALETPVGGVR